MTRFVCVIACLFGVTFDSARAADPEFAGQASHLVFHGWSANSQWVAYTRFYPETALAGREPTPAREQRMHRRIRKGRFAGFGKMVGGAVAAFAAERRYDATACVRTNPSPRSFHFACKTAAFDLEVEVGRSLGFVITRAGAHVFRHTFDRLYVAFDPQLYPSPDGKQGLLAFHLDSGWDVDAAVFPLVLRAKGSPKASPAD